MRRLTMSPYRFRGLYLVHGCRPTTNANCSTSPAAAAQLPSCYLFIKKIPRGCSKCPSPRLVSKNSRETHQHAALNYSTWQPWTVVGERAAGGRGPDFSGRGHTEKCHCAEPPLQLRDGSSAADGSGKFANGDGFGCRGEPCASAVFISPRAAPRCVLV